MMLADAADELIGTSDVAASVRGVWLGILEDLWRDPVIREALLAKVRVLFWQSVWPKLKDRTLVLWFKLSAIQWVFEHVFGPPP